MLSVRIHLDNMGIGCCLESVYFRTRRASPPFANQDFCRASRCLPSEPLYEFQCAVSAAVIHKDKLVDSEFRMRGDCAAKIRQKAREGLRLIKDGHHNGDVSIQHPATDSAHTNVQ